MHKIYTYVPDRMKTFLVCLPQKIWAARQTTSIHIIALCIALFAMGDAMRNHEMPQMPLENTKALREQL